MPQIKALLAANGCSLSKSDNAELWHTTAEFIYMVAGLMVPATQLSVQAP